MSIITEALKKAEKERSKPVDSKEYLSKIIGPPVDMSSYRKEEPRADMTELTPDLSGRDTEPMAARAGWRTSRTLIISGVLIVGAIVFLSAMNVFLMSSVDTKTAQSTHITKPGGDYIEAETYTTAMYPDINRIERKGAILDKMSMVLKGAATKDQFMSNFTLNGIIYDADNSWAIINNKMVKTGDVFDGAEVLSISPHKVAILFKNEVFDLTVK